MLQVRVIQQVSGLCTKIEPMVKPWLNIVHIWMEFPEKRLQFCKILTQPTLICGLSGPGCHSKAQILGISDHKNAKFQDLIPGLDKLPNARVFYSVIITWPAQQHSNDN